MNVMRFRRTSPRPVRSLFEVLSRMFFLSFVLSSKLVTQSRPTAIKIRPAYSVDAVSSELSWLLEKQKEKEMHKNIKVTKKRLSETEKKCSFVQFSFFFNVSPCIFPFNN